METAGGSSACRLDKQHKRLKDTKLQFSRRGGGGSSACRMEEQHKRLEDPDAHFNRRGGGGSSACGLEDQHKRLEDGKVQLSRIKLCSQVGREAQETGGHQVATQ